MGGVTPLLQTLKGLEEKGVKGQILTTNYLNFSEPRALEKLNGLKNITLKMYDVEAAGNGFHTKGYIFKKEEIYRIIIGSSNMTSAALTVNKEWNTKLIFTENGEVAEEIVEEFHNLWNSEYALPYDDFYDIYKERYNIIQGYVPMNLQYLANSFKVNRLNLQILRKSIEEHLDLKSVHHR